MNMDRQSVNIETRELRRDFFYDGTKMVQAVVEYPIFSSPHFPVAVRNMNAFYFAQAMASMRYAATELYHSAIADYKYRKENGYPFNNYELDRNTVITYNYNCTLSLYSDQYTYTGGAHGNVVRTSQTWNLNTGRQIPLSWYFPGNPRYSQSIKREIKRQIAAQMQGGEGPFFPDYDRLVDETFNEDHYFLTNDALVIYFQQYDIAPYSSGLPEFQIPFGTIPMRRPSCNNRS